MNQYTKYHMGAFITLNTPSTSSSQTCGRSPANTPHLRGTPNKPASRNSQTPGIQHSNLSPLRTNFSPPRSVALAMPTPPTTPRHLCQRNRAPTSTPSTPNRPTNPLSPRMKAVAETSISDISPLTLLSTPARPALSPMSPSRDRESRTRAKGRKPTSTPTPTTTPKSAAQLQSTIQGPIPTSNGGIGATPDPSTPSLSPIPPEIKLLTCPTCLKTSLRIVSPIIHPNGKLSRPCHMCSSCFADFAEKERRFRQKTSFVSFPRLMEDRGEGEGEGEGGESGIGKPLAGNRNGSWGLGEKVMGLFMGGRGSSRDQSEASTERSCSARGSEFIEGEGRGVLGC
ncbi:hypothetical protein BCR34DRAFT_613650 [Clohesyomyces aquaticus]|uniref:Uncharacterized protein n=1 Tax=Clohesyomyces aquaticus TaxID=1231657 RepID=A0A1Y1ZRM7_9PLEO|nr:hypothetical protein BCR34DRAFT_613650 [Clohesyomyces aquaticus]